MFDASLGLLAASSYRLVYGLAIVLALLGVAMIILTVWLVRSTRPDPRVLARLETMGSRRWWRAGTIGRRQQLEAVPISAADARDDDDDDDDDPAGQARTDTDDDVDGGQSDETGSDTGGASDGLGDTRFDDLDDAPFDDVDGIDAGPGARDALIAGDDGTGDADNGDTVDPATGGLGGDQRDAADPRRPGPDADDDTPQKGLGRGSGSADVRS